MFLNLELQPFFVLYAILSSNIFLKEKDFLISTFDILSLYQFTLFKL